MLDQVEQRCGAPPGAALADSGFFSIENLEQMEQHNIDGYVPDSNMARALNLGARCRTRACAPAHRRMRAKLRSSAGQAAYARRKAVVEPVFGVLKQQRGMRQFRTRGLNKVGNEFTLATLAFNITRLHVMRAALNSTAESSPTGKQIKAALQPAKFNQITAAERGRRRSHEDTFRPSTLRHLIDTTIGEMAEYRQTAHASIARARADRGHEVAIVNPTPAPGKLIAEAGLTSLPIRARPMPAPAFDLILVSEAWDIEHFLAAFIQARSTALERIIEKAG